VTIEISSFGWHGNTSIKILAVNGLKGNSGSYGLHMVPGRFYPGGTR